MSDAAVSPRKVFRGVSGPVELRFDDDGTLDEAVGLARVHLEKMHDGEFFLSNGRLAANDLEVVAGLREWLLTTNRPRCHRGPDEAMASHSKEVREAAQQMRELAAQVADRRSGIWAKNGESTLAGEGDLIAERIRAIPLPGDPETKLEGAHEP